MVPLAVVGALVLAIVFAYGVNMLIKNVRIKEDSNPDIKLNDKDDK